MNLNSPRTVEKRFLPRGIFGKFSHFLSRFPHRKYQKNYWTDTFLGSVIKLENCNFLLKLFSLLEIEQLNLSEAKPNNAINLKEKTLFENQEKVE